MLLKLQPLIIFGFLGMVSTFINMFSAKIGVKQLPDSYKEHFQSSADVLNEICDHARNKMFNHHSARELLVHLNINQTAILTVGLILLNHSRA